MQDVIEHCEKTITEANTEILALETNLRTHTDENQYTEIKKAIITNQQNKKRSLEQSKNKKFYALKYSHNVTPTQPLQTMNNPTVNQQNNTETPQTSNTGVFRRKSNTTINNNNSRNWTKPASRKSSKTNAVIGTNQNHRDIETKNDDTKKLQEKIQQLQNQLDAQTKQPETQSSSTRNNDNFEQKKQQKNLDTPQNTDKGGAPDINKMLNYIQTAMQTLNDFTKQLTQAQGTTQTHMGM